MFEFFKKNKILILLLLFIFYPINASADPYDITLPYWNNYVFGFDSTSWGRDAILSNSGDYAGYGHVYQSSRVTFPDSTSLYYNVIVNNLDFSTKSYNLDFVLTGNLMPYLEAVNVNSNICEIAYLDGKACFISCPGVRFKEYIYNNKSWNRLEISAFFDLPENVSVTSTFGIVDNVNIKSSNPEQDAADSLLGPNTNYDNIDDTPIQDYHNSENALIFKDNLNNINDIRLSLDYNASNLIWSIVNNVLNSHVLIFSMCISILSIGIIKLVLNR